MMTFLQGWKQGLQDMCDVINDGGYKLFLWPVIVIIAGFLLLRWGSSRLNEQTKTVRTQIDAIRVQQSSEQDYLSSKRKLLSLEPQFPEVKEKDQWLIQQLLEVFQQTEITPNMNEVQVENSANPNYLTVSKKVSFSSAFPDFAKLLAAVESRQAYLRISDLSVLKSADTNEVGVNNVTMTFNTAFPKEKLAPVLFKDYKGAQK